MFQLKNAFKRGKLVVFAVNNLNLPSLSRLHTRGSASIALEMLVCEKRVLSAT